MEKPPAPVVTPPGALVCVYYEVALLDRPAAISQVREFQRRLAGRWPGLAMEVLVRCESGPAAAVETGRATLMETYRHTLDRAASRDAGPACDPAPMPALLAALEDAALPLRPLLRGTRHVEVFAPCAS